jgi:hypothetical protein
MDVEGSYGQALASLTSRSLHRRVHRRVFQAIREHQGLYRYQFKHPTGNENSSIRVLCIVYTPNI